MSTASELPDPTAPEGAPHPRETPRLFGQAAAEEAFLQAFTSGRLHHGWLLTGPQGIGKATLAYRIARFLLATPAGVDDGLFGAPAPPKTLNVAPDHPVSRRILAGSEPGLFVLRRGPNDKGDRLSADIRVNDVRALKSFFGLSATDGGRRVVIVDAADDLNVNAANALLKLLEEPPADATLLLVAHQPSRLLPTIRSRCRSLALSPLSAGDLSAAMDHAGVTIDPSEATALSELAAGSVGGALRLVAGDGLKFYAEIVELLGTLPDLDRDRAIRLAEKTSGRGAEARRDLLIALLDIALARLARTGATGSPPTAQGAPHESTVFARLSPTASTARHWAALQAEIGDRLRHGRAVNIDASSLYLDALIRLAAPLPA